jgi:hypothetical protein
LWVVYPGGETYDLHEKITVLPLSRVGDAVETHLGDS